jgi:hypothetical protein
MIFGAACATPATSAQPSAPPTEAPTLAPTGTPTPEPTAEPTVTPEPTPTATSQPVGTPTPKPPVTPIPLQTPLPGNLDPRFGVSEGFRDAPVMADVGAGWERVVLSWADIQPNGPDDWSWLGRTLPPRAVAGELNRGVRLAGLLQFTPDWAATDLDDPGRSVPQNLDLPDDDPDNYWGRFVYETVRYYTGRIDEWIVWNEPEFHPDDAAGRGSYTWLGTDAEFARLMEVAYLAAKRANPNATVAFPGTSYWVDRNAGRLQFYERFLRQEAANPDARAHNFFHDTVPLNLYRAPDDLVRLHQEFRNIEKKYAVDKPLWLLELNAMPTDDRSIPCADQHTGGAIQTTQVQQAAYAIQALALAAAVGYERIGFYQMIDDDPCNQSAVWGITRDDGSRRPVADSLRTAVRTFSGFDQAQFAPLVRTPARWAAWPNDPASLIPNWRVYQVVFDLPSGRRVTALWNGDGVPVRVRVPRQGSSEATLLDMSGSQVQGPAPSGQDWVITLPAATAHFAGDPVGYYFIGGEPRLLIQDAVPRQAPVAPPRLA